MDDTRTKEPRCRYTGPRLQNIPVRTELGRALHEDLAKDGPWIVSADFAQIELRVLASVEGEEAQRSRGKSQNFERIYGFVRKAAEGEESGKPRRPR